MALLARELQIPRDRVAVVAGHGSRRKVVAIDLDDDELERRLTAVARRAAKE